MMKKKIFSLFSMCLLTIQIIASTSVSTVAADSPRSAPNLYVDWPVNGTYDLMMVDWYCEQDALNTYWAVHNWDGGYAGFQNVNGNHVLLMSLWDMANGTRPVIEYVRGGKNGDFGGEGEGKQVFTDYNWQINKWYTMRVEVWTADGKSYYGQWIREESGAWIQTAIISYPVPNRYFNGDSMFQEDFGSNNLSASCRLRNIYGRFYGTNNWDSRNQSTIRNTYFPPNATWENGVMWNVNFDCDWGTGNDDSYIRLQSGGGDFTPNGKEIPKTLVIHQNIAPSSPDAVPDLHPNPKPIDPEPITITPAPGPIIPLPPPPPPPGGYTTILKITMDKLQYTENGVQKMFDVAPYQDTHEWRSMIPMRFIAEAFGAYVSWDDATKTQTISLSGKTFTITQGVPLPNGMGTATLIRDRFMVPLRYVSEQLGGHVDWDESTLSNTITY